jgi:hypothetical protein
MVRSRASLLHAAAVLVLPAARHSTAGPRACVSLGACCFVCFKRTVALDCMLVDGEVRLHDRCTLHSMVVLWWIRRKHAYDLSCLSVCDQADAVELLLLSVAAPCG